MKHFLNHPHSLVQEAIDGLVARSGGLLSRLDGFPDIKVVLRSQVDGSKVALISGGGSGHEPAHAGFVGEGMLTAAVAGEIFASPSSQAVLAAILAVTGPAGCLLIVKNYTGDRLNFGLAAEQARARGLRVEVVLVADDVALPDSEQPRGIAGTLFVHKIAGALAEAGAGLEEVATVARQVAAASLSIGLSLNSCSPPGHSGEQRLAAEQAELGLGIHGEPGAETISLGSAQAMLDAMFERFPANPPGCALLLNNLGAVPALEMDLLTHLLLQSRLAPRVELLIGPATMMTAYDMYGFSVSLLPLAPGWAEALQAPTQAPAWPLARKPQWVRPVPLPKGLRPLAFESSFDGLVERTLLTVCQVLEASEVDLNALDRQVGDGDTGSTMARASRAIREALADLPMRQPALLLQALSQILGTSMGGSSGVLLSIFLAAASEAVEDGWGGAWYSGLKRLQEVGGARSGQRTLVDALEPALLALSSQGPAAAARAARWGADNTASMDRAGAGRSAHVPGDSLRGVVDPGAEAVARVFEGLVTVLEDDPGQGFQAPAGLS